MNSTLRMITTFVLLSGGFSFAAEPVVEWRFDGESQVGTWLGKPGTLADGPWPPKYPGFEAGNTAMSFTGHQGAILIEDHESGGDANVRFDKGTRLPLRPG
ncbi:MAG: hypothetical protein ABI614_21310 [Planctomycetota bacterium]